ncbi:MAG: pyruvate kinase [Gammaproteobacteria bacterium]|nr:pyruvate kinase [Gammaproteobacteria bacterium]
MRRTKIVATLGPSSDNVDILCQMLQQGVDVVRVNFSHGEAGEQEGRVNRVREVAKKVGKEVAILADLQGPKIRIAKFRNRQVTLIRGDSFILDAAMASGEGDEKAVGIDYKELPNDVFAGDTLLLDDGRIVLHVEQVSSPQIQCRVEVGGLLSNNKGINRRGGGLSAKALTEKDKKDIKTACSLEVDYIAVSFPRTAEDIKEARNLIHEAGGNACIIAKIERQEAVNAIDEIILASDGVMVARGDLAVEIGEAAVPGVQKHIIHRARTLDRPVITATQMMESMIHSSVPTRAEVSDVANAILDGTDAVMLSAETAVGSYPVEVIEAVSRICVGAEKHPRTLVSKHRVESHFGRIDEAIAMATMYAANHMNIKAIVALTESGATPLWMSRIRSGIPIFGLSRHLRTLRKMTLFRGVYPIHFDATQIHRPEINKRAVEELLQKGLVSKGDLVIVTKGSAMGVHGGTNSMKIVEVGKK